MPQFLLLRSDDFVLFGVEWLPAGFRLEVNAPGGARLIAVSSEARLSITFPPQIVAEQKMLSDTDVSTRSSTRSSSSVVSFKVPVGTLIPLTVEGVLEALLAPGTAVLSRGPSLQEAPTAIELPWRLLVSVVPGPGATLVISDHAVRPVASSSKVTGLWHLRLRADTGDTQDARLSLLPLRVLPHGEMDPPSTLSNAHKQRIVDLSQQQGLPSVTRLELSALGGSLSAGRSWPNFEWEHHVVVGRDARVRLLEKGFFYPFGHRAEFVELTQRTFGPLRQPEFVPPSGGTHGSSGSGSGASSGPGGHPPENPPDDPPDPDPVEPPPPPPPSATAGLYSQRTLTLTESIRGAVSDPRLARRFPFEEVEILDRVLTGIDDPGSADFFVPSVNRKPVMFSLRCLGANSDVHLSMPLLFVRDTGLRTSDEVLAAAFRAHGSVKVPGVAIDMIRSSTRRDGDLFEVHELGLTGFRNAGNFAPSLSYFSAELPALRALLPAQTRPVALALTERFLNEGEGVDLAVEPIDRDRILAGSRVLKPIGIDFTNRPDRSGGLVTPKFAADKISRALGPVPAEALVGLPDLKKIYEGASLLGLPLGDLIHANSGKDTPTIITKMGSPPTVELTWKPQLKTFLPFVAKDTTILDLKAIVGGTPPQSTTTCSVRDFDFVLPPIGPRLLILTFAELAFTQLPGQPPDLKISGLKVTFDDTLKLIQELAERLASMIGGPRPTVRPTPAGISVAYSFGIPSVPAGAFLLRNISVRVGVDVPFTPKPVTVSLGFAARDNPFNLSVMMFGGGGYIAVQFGSNGLIAVEASMEFGAFVAVNFIVAKGEVHALGGVRLYLMNGEIVLDAFIRIGGSVQALGLVSVSIELVVLLTYQSEHNRLIGNAKLVIEIDVTLYSGSITIDSGQWVLAGSDPAIALQPFNSQEVLTALREYREAFAA